MTNLIPFLVVMLVTVCLCWGFLVAVFRSQYILAIALATALLLILAVAILDGGKVVASLRQGSISVSSASEDAESGEGNVTKGGNRARTKQR